MCVHPWAAEMKLASNCDGARYTPWPSMPWNQAAKRLVSQVFAVSKFVTFTAVKNTVNMEPIRLMVTGLAAASAALRISSHRNAALLLIFL